MAVFKDLMDAIFNEEVDSDDDYEEMDEYEESLDIASFGQNKTVTPVEEITVEVEDQFLHPTPKPIKKEKATSSFMDISIDDAPKAKKAKKASQKAVVRKPQETVDYTPIISPIFGNTEESKKEFDKVHNAIELKKPVEAEAFTQIISPMFGTDLPKAKRVIPTMNVESNLSVEEMLQESNDK
ncbi:MAG: hypothetical protein Q4C49_07245 [Bacillota bacterium]|nr:hypothetical protein [Bacillota bacterium]